MLNEWFYIPLCGFSATLFVKHIKVMIYVGHIDLRPLQNFQDNDGKLMMPK